MEEPTTTQVAEGIPAETGSQAAPPSTQVDTKPQETTGSQVETSKSQATSTEEIQRQKPSEFYRSRDTQRRRLESALNRIKVLEERLQSKPEPQPTSRKPSIDELKKKFWDSGPDNFVIELLEKMQELESKFSGFKEKEIPELFQQHNSISDFNRRTQEAMEKLFPKSDPNSKETWEERAEKDPERATRIFEIMKDYGFDVVSKKDPEKAAKGILQILNAGSKEPARSPFAPRKGQMVSTSTGSPTGGGKTMNAQEFSSEISKITQQLSNDPTLFNDEKFMEKWRLLKEGATQKLQV